MGCYSAIGQELAEKTFREHELGTKPKQDSRNWKDPEGYRFLFPWSNTILLRYFIRLLTDSLPKSEYRRKVQLDDAARSVVRNIEEGFKRSTTVEYLQFLGYSQGSLEECKGDIRELTEDGYLKSISGSSLTKIGINLKDLNISLRKRDNKGCLKENKGTLGEFCYRPLTVLYSPLSSLKFPDLTYEIFLELINKTDFLLRKLVESLEKKLANDRKYYQVEQLKLKRKIET